MSASVDQELVATFVTGAPKLSLAFLKDAAALIQKTGGQSVRTEVLAQDKAADIFFHGVPAEKLRAAIAGSPLPHSVDVLIQPVAARRKKLLVADMESTIIQQEMLDEMATMLGFGEEIAAITRRSMNGEVDFTTSLRARVMLLMGQPVSMLDEAAKRITLMPGAEALLNLVKKNGAVAWLVTGGFTYFARPVAKRLGFDRVYANELIIRNGVLTGELAGPILDRNGKKQWLEKACAELGITMAETMAVGDGANDIAMLSACNAGGGLGVAYHAKPSVRAATPHQINHGDLTALIYAGGMNEAAAGESIQGQTQVPYPQ